MNLEIVFNFGEITAYIASAALFFMGLKKMVSYLKDDSENSRSIKMKSVKLISSACGCYALAAFFRLFFPMSTEGYNLTAIVLEAAWNAVTHTGFLILLPFFIKGNGNRGPQ